MGVRLRDPDDRLYIRRLRTNGPEPVTQPCFLREYFHWLDIVHGLESTEGQGS